MFTFFEDFLILFPRVSETALLIRANFSKNFASTHSAQMKISVIVSTYNHPSYLTLVLDSLKNQVNAGEYEIVIADDGSGPETKR